MATTSLRLAFLGTPDFAVPILAALIAAGHDIAAVYCQPPRPAGRGRKVRPSPVQAAALAETLEVRAPATLKDAQTQAAFQALGLDAAIVAAYGLILPPPMLGAPRLGCINVHASLLPRWRGAAPIQRAILAGDQETGISIMQMDEGLDTGPVLLSRSHPISPVTTGGMLHDELAQLGAGLIIEALAGLAQNTLTSRPQPDEGATYAHRIDAAEAHIDWTRKADEIARQIRAFNPWPGAWFATADGTRIRALAVESVDGPGDGPGDGTGDPGHTLDDALTVACGIGALRIIEVQRAGKAAMKAADFLRGHPIAKDARLA